MGVLPAAAHIFQLFWGECDGALVHTPELGVCTNAPSHSPRFCMQWVITTGYTADVFWHKFWTFNIRWLRCGRFSSSSPPYTWRRRTRACLCRLLLNALRSRTQPASPSKTSLSISPPARCPVDFMCSLWSGASGLPSFCRGMQGLCERRSSLGIADCARGSGNPKAICVSLTAER